MKKIVFNLMHNSFLFSMIITRIINLKNYCFKSYEKVLSEKKELDIWDVEKLSQEMRPYYSDSTPNSSYYGITYHLKKYAQTNKIIGLNSEHGLYFGDYVEKESEGKSVRKNVTISNKRLDILKKADVSNGISVGPYINYVPEYYDSSKTKKIKKDLGKVLLAFPPHSTRTVDAVYDKKLFIDYLNKQKENFDTIMVCFFYKDIQNGAHINYKENGFLIVSAGHMFDANFLSRQKTMISLADHTVSATVGTHIGYCIFLGKSHEIVNLSNNNINGNKHKSIDKKNDNQDLANIVRPMFDRDEDLMLETFLEGTNSTDEEKYKLASEYWGFDCVRTNTELKKMFYSKCREEA